MPQICVVHIPSVRKLYKDLVHLSSDNNSCEIYIVSIIGQSSAVMENKLKADVGESPFSPVTSAACIRAISFTSMTSSKEYSSTQSVLDSFFRSSILAGPALDV